MRHLTRATLLISALAWAVLAWGSSHDPAEGWETMNPPKDPDRWERWRCEDGDYVIMAVPQCAHHDTPSSTQGEAEVAEKLSARNAEAQRLAQGIVWITSHVRFALILIGTAAMIAVLGRALIEGKVPSGRMAGTLAAVALISYTGGLAGFILGGDDSAEQAVASGGGDLGGELWSTIREGDE